MDIQKEFAQIKQQYEDDARQDTFNVLVTGETGTGKTHLARTARKPVHVDSFDPGGTKTLRREIKEGKILADTRWEDENPADPWAFKEWVKEYNRRVQGGYFEHIATYVLDSLTMWQESLMHHIMAKDGVAGQTPRFTKDYGPHKTKAKNFVGRLLSLPCDVIITGHLDSTQDDVTGRTTYRLMTTGTNKVQIPSLFDELWVMDPKEIGGEVQYRVLTKATGRYIARSRLANEGQLDTYEDPNIKKILHKAGLPTHDLPLPGELEKADSVNN